MNQQQAFDFYKDFLKAPRNEQFELLVSKDSDFWEEVGFQKALSTFHRAAVEVPAYKDFLQKNSIDHTKIISPEDYKLIPTIDKKNYLRAYPLNELAWGGNLDKQNVISVSSGSTGQPFFWPRDIDQENETDHQFSLFLLKVLKAEKKKTLIINAFAMGMYIGGPFTFAASMRLGQEGNPITVTTPGIDVPGVLRVAQNISQYYEQTIICGYPPMVKDILDAGAKEGINWQQINTKVFFGGEGYSESWREHLHQVLGQQSLVGTSINMYGTADAAVLGVETPVSILFRKIASLDSNFNQEYFLSERLPSVITYNPLLKYFETLEDRSLVFTSSAGIPLIRYRIGDVGGLVRYKAVEHALNQRNSSIEDALQKEGFKDTNWKLPLLYLFGRDDFTVHLYGLNIYPENIKDGLEDPRINQLVTGKFVMSIEYKRSMAQQLNIKVELAANIKEDKTIKTLIREVITENLKQRNAEYRELYAMLKRKADPKIVTVEHGSKAFSIKIKHSWVNKFAKG